MTSFCPTGPGYSDMWKFTAHTLLDSTQWSWTEYGRTGKKERQSMSFFSSYARAVRNATDHGFDLIHHQYTIVETGKELQVPDGAGTARSRRAQAPGIPGGSAGTIAE